MLKTLLQTLLAALSVGTVPAAVGATLDIAPGSKIAYVDAEGSGNDRRWCLVIADADGRDAHVQPQHLGRPHARRLAHLQPRRPNMICLTAAIFASSLGLRASQPR